MLVFSRSPGAVFRYDGQIAPISISIEGFGPSLRCALLSIGVGGEANAAITNSLKKTVYVYTMGEKPGTIELSGIVFPTQTCAILRGRLTGFEKIRTYYQTYNVSANGAPVIVTIGKTVIEGFLMRWRCNISQPETGVGAFSLIMMTPPES